MTLHASRVASVPRTRRVSPSRIRRALFASLAWFCVTLTAAGGAEAAVRAQFDRTAVREGDPVTLIIESDSRSSDKPDLAPLQRDFDVLSTSTSTQLNFINGHRSDLTRWILQLQPRRLGTIDVAPIAVGNEQTAALSLSVTTMQAQGAGDQGKHLILESESGTTGKAVYVQQQIPYTLRLYYDDTLQGGDLPAPHADNAIIEKLGEDKRYTATRDGHVYSVIERHYAVAAEKSGTLQIPAVTFRGTAIVASPGSDDSDDMLLRFLRNSPFANDPALRNRLLAGSRLASAGQPVTARSQEVTLDVRPRPATVTGSWLPAEEVVLHDSWADNPPQLKAGEPAKRTITVEVRGLAASQIPGLDFAQPDNARTYPEAADNQSRTDGNAVYGISKQSVTYIPTAAGTLTVPAIALDWWNTRTDSAAHAALAPRSFSVAPGLPIAQTPPASPAPAIAPRPVAKPAPSPSLLDRLRAAAWPMLVMLGIIVVVVAATWRLRTLRRGGADGRVTGPASKRRDAKAATIALQQACSANNPIAATRALMEMAKAHWPDDPPSGLQQIADRLLLGRDAIAGLERAAYGANAAAWNGSALWQALCLGFADTRTRPPRAVEQTELPDVEPLYR